MGDPILLHFHQGLDGLDEVLHGQRGNAQPLGGVLIPLGVAVRAEQLDLAVGGTIGLHALKDLLCIVQHHAGRVHLERRIGDNAGVVPALTGVIVHYEHVVGKDLTKAQLALVGGLGLRGGRLCDFDIQHVKTLPFFQILKFFVGIKQKDFRIVPDVRERRKSNFRGTTLIAAVEAATQSPGIGGRPARLTERTPCSAVLLPGETGKVPPAASHQPAAL